MRFFVRKKAEDFIEILSIICPKFLISVLKGVLNSVLSAIVLDLS
jgi:hypothetical protein